MQKQIYKWVRSLAAFALPRIVFAALFILCTDGHSQTNPCVPPPSGLVGWWPGNGNADDIAGGNNGTLINGVTYAPAEVGVGFDLTTADAVVLVSNTPALQLQNFTIECWVQRASTSAVTETPNVNPDGIVFGYGGGGYAFGLQGDGTLFLTQTYVGNIASPLAVNDTSFHHVAVTTSGGTVFFYLDGVAFAAGTYAPTFQFSGPAAIGGPGNLALATFYGILNELSIYNRALSSPEIQSIFNAGPAGKCMPVVPTNVAPYFPFMGEQVIDELMLLAVTNTAIESDTEATLSYSLLNAPTGLAINTNGIITWTPSQAQSHSTNTITTVATSTDNFDAINPQLSATNTFIVIVKEVNEAPTLPVIPTQVAYKLTQMTVTNTASESNVNATLNYILIGAPAGVSINAGGIITWTPSQAVNLGTNIITTVATSSDIFDLIHPQISVTNNFAVLVNGYAFTLFTLTNSNSLLRVSPRSPRGLYVWTVNGVNQLHQKWWWLSIGSNTAPQSVDSLSLPYGLSPPSSSNATITYSSSELSATVELLLTGGNPGTYGSTLYQNITLQNITDYSFTAHLYAYSDFDLAGNPDGDTVLSLGAHAVVQQGKGMTLTGTVQAPTPNEWEAGWFDFILESLVDGYPVTLTDGVIPEDPGDQTFAYEWDANLEPRQSLAISLIDYLGLSPVNLNVSLSGNTVIISWPTNGASNFQLYQATALGSPANWSVVTNVQEVEGQKYEIAAPFPSHTQFYRLQK